nr:Uncharacterised protein [Raoultella sp. NCTC 9187]
MSASAKYFFIIPGVCVVLVVVKAVRPLPFFRRRIAFDMHILPFKQELNHLLLKQLAVLYVHHVELLLVDQHGLFVLPLGPGFFGDLVIDAFAEIARVELEILAIPLRAAGKYKK